MDVIIDGAGMQEAAGRIDVAVRELALIGKRVQPLLVRLTSGEKALFSDALSSKYVGFGNDVELLCSNMEELQRTMSELTKAYIDKVDEADRFMY